MKSHQRHQASGDHIRELVKDLRIRRHQVNFTQKQLARAAGVGISTIQRMESGRTLIQLSTLLAIADSLGTELRAAPKPLESQHWFSQKN